jgi:hypothetical protein
LENSSPDQYPEDAGVFYDAKDALRAALEQPEQPNPWRDAVDHELSTLHMVASDDPRESIRRLIDWHCAVQIDPLVSSAAQELIERGKREALEQPDQEPVAWANKDDFGKFDMRVRCNTDHYHTEPLWASPPRREWRGLTDTERAAVQYESFKRGLTPLEFMELHEAALRSKNHE